MAEKIMQVIFSYAGRDATLVFIANHYTERLLPFCGAQPRVTFFRISYEDSGHQLP